MAEVEWVEVGPGFGSSLPFGSCNALVVERGVRMICGYPRDREGDCTAAERHGKPKENESRVVGIHDGRVMSATWAAEAEEETDG